MSTRGGIIFKKNGETCVKLYNHYDSYIGGLGKEIRDFLVDFEIVNGITLGEHKKRQANGMGCLIAQFIAEKKTCAGGLYVESCDIDFRDSFGIEYIYEINGVDFDNNFKIDIEVNCVYEGLLFKGNLEEYDKYITKETEKKE